VRSDTEPWIITAAAAAIVRRDAEPELKAAAQTASLHIATITCLPLFQFQTWRRALHGRPL
jgi:hypothetical protein